MHEPRGWEHPFDYEPIERVPRDPHVGQPIRIHFRVADSESPVSMPVVEWRQGDRMGRANSVKWEGREAESGVLVPPGPPDGPDTSEVGTAASGGTADPVPNPASSGPADCWVARIGPFSSTTAVSYRIRTGDAESEPFEFVPLRRVRARIVTVTDGFALTHAELPEHLRFSVHDGGGNAPELTVTADLVHGELNVKGAAGEAMQSSPDRFALSHPAGSGSQLLLRSAYLTVRGDSIIAVRLAWESPVEEQFFGLGERYNQIGARGRTVESRVFDQYKHQGEKTYLPVPFFLSTRGYSHGVLTDHPVRFDFGVTEQEAWSIEWEMEETPLSWSVSWGSPAELLKRWQKQTGPATRPPRWAFAPWLSSNEWNTQARVMREVSTAEELGVPTGVVVIEAWSDEQTFYIWNGAEYEPRPGGESFSYDDFSFPADGPWPNPKEMIDQLHRRGIKLILWQIPIQKHSPADHPQREADERHIQERGYPIRRTDGSEYRIPGPAWFQHSLVPDLTDKEAADWFMEKRRYLVEDLGVDGFKTDGGEHLWAPGFRTADGPIGRSLINAFPRTYTERYHELFAQRGRPDGMAFSRAGYTGSQRSTFFWNGDQDSTWEEFRSQLRACLNAAMSGIPFIGWDIGGFSGPIPTPELYIRSTQAATFSPLMQIHSEYNHHREPHNDRTPWNIARRWNRPDVLDIYRSYANVRMQLIDFIENLADQAVESGLPLMAPLYVHYPEDEQARHVDDQYLFGPDLLVAPVLSEGVRERPVYLPHGPWQDCWTGTTETGGWITTESPLARIPLYARGDTYALVSMALQECFEHA